MPRAQKASKAVGSVRKAVKDTASGSMWSSLIAFVGAAIVFFVIKGLEKAK